MVLCLKVKPLLIQPRKVKEQQRSVSEGEKVSMNRQEQDRVLKANMSLESLSESKIEYVWQEREHQKLHLKLLYKQNQTSWVKKNGEHLLILFLVFF